MHNNYHFFLHLTKAIKPKLQGLKLMDCFSQEKNEMVLGFAEARGIKNNYKQYFIRCSVLPVFSGFYFTKDYRRAKKNSINLWEQYYDLEVKDVFTFPYERAIGIQLENEVCICFKMYGNRSNILVFEGKKVVCIFNTTLKADFNIEKGDLYKSAPLSPEVFEVNYKKTYPTLGKVPKYYLEEKEFENQTKPRQRELLIELFEELKKPPFYITKLNEISHLSLLSIGEVVETIESPIEASNRFFVYGQRFQGLEKEKSALLKDLVRELKNTENYIQKAKKRLSELENSTKNQEVGHILMANLHTIPPRAEKVDLYDFINDKQIEIKLKSDLNPQENAQNYYRKAKNEQLEINNVKENIKAREEKQLELESLQESISEIDDLKSIRKQKALLSAEKPEYTNELFKTFDCDDWQIWIGKNSKNNELLTLKYAKKNDIWLHVKDVSGSHTVIKDKPGQKVPNHVLEYAAGLAAYFSKRRTETLVPVIYTLKKYVRKMKGTPDGQVIVDKEQVVIVPPVSPS